jgi:hypothetical protein
MVGQRRQNIGARRLAQHGQGFRAHAEIIGERGLGGIAGMDGVEPDLGPEAKGELEGARIEIGAPAAPRGWVAAD